MKYNFQKMPCIFYFVFQQDSLQFGEIEIQLKNKAYTKPVYIHKNAFILCVKFTKEFKL